MGNVSKSQVHTPNVLERRLQIFLKKTCDLSIFSNMFYMCNDLNTSLSYIHKFDGAYGVTDLVNFQTKGCFQK